MRQFTKPQNRYSHYICPFPLLYPSLGGVPQSYSITLLLTAITIPWRVQGVSPWFIISSSCFNLYNHNTDINTPFVPFPLSIPPWGVSPQSFYHYFLLTTITIPWGVQGVSPWLFLSISCVNLQNLNTDIHTPFFPIPLSIPPWGCPPNPTLYSSFLLTTITIPWSRGYGSRGSPPG